MHVLVTGATGYIGGRLVPRLLDAGHSVRVLVRDAGRIEGNPWADRVEVVEGDILAEVPTDLCNGIDAAYYLIHSMAAHKDFASHDVDAAQRFSKLAKKVPHVIYLGGLQPKEQATAHLASRAETGAELAKHLPVTEFRAGPVVGSGSASFEMVRYLTERLPIMVTPKWVTNEVCPIAVRDVLSYLTGVLELGPQGVVDIAGESLPFGEMMMQYAEVRGLRRRIFATPVLAPTLAARWVQFVTPISNRIAVPLLGGIVHPIPADTAKARKMLPNIHPMLYREAVRVAIEREALDDVETKWTGSIGDAPTYQMQDWENLMREERDAHIDAPQARVFEEVCRVGGSYGWPAWNWAWKIRGGIDRVVGGPGLRRGRRSKKVLREGDAVDFWRVEELDAPNRLRLRSEMRMPGRAWLQYDVIPEDAGTRLVQTAFYEPRGLAGVLYWKSLYPVHRLLFRDMAKALKRRAET